MIEVVRKSQVDGCDVPDVSFLDSLAVLVLLRNEYFVVCLVASHVVILLDGLSQGLVEVLEKLLGLTQQAVGSTLLQVEAVLREEADDALHGHGVEVAQLGDACNERAVVVGAEERGVGSLAFHDGAVLHVLVHMVDALDEAHGDEDVTGGFALAYPPGPFLVKPGVIRIYGYMLHLCDIVVYPLCPVVGLLAGLWRRGGLGAAFVRGRLRLWRGLLLRLVLHDLGQTLGDIALLLLFLGLLDEQLLQLCNLLQQLIHLPVGIRKLLLEAGHQLPEHQDNLVLIHTAKVIKKDETTKKKANYF